MKIIEKYILKEVKIPVIFGISLFTFIFLIDIIMAMMENIIVRGISVIDTIRILSFYLPPILAQTIPMGLFLGIMATFSKFTRNSESIAMSSMGMSLKDIIMPIAKMAGICTLFIFFLQESIIPQSFEKLQYLTTKIAMENPVFQMKEKTFMNEIEEFSLYIDSIDHKSGVSKGVLIFQKDENSLYPILVSGKTSQWKNNAMVLDNAEFFTFKDNGTEQLRGEFQEKKIPLSAYASEIKIKFKDIETMGIRQLLSEIKGKEKGKKLPYIIEINKKLAVPLSALMLSILGVLLANGHHRSGKGASFALSLVVIFIYIIFLNIGLVMANKGKVSPFIGVWTPDFILSIATYLLYKHKAKVM